IASCTLTTGRPKEVEVVTTAVSFRLDWLMVRMPFARVADRTCRSSRPSRVGREPGRVAVVGLQGRPDTVDRSLITGGLRLCQARASLGGGASRRRHVQATLCPLVRR